MKLFAVTGNPILFSKSPRLHRTWFLENKIDAVYTRLSAETAEEALQLAKELKMSGLNVTAPFKETMISLLDTVDQRALNSNAVNTVVINDAESSGFTTDSDGVLFALRDIEIKDRTVCIIGNGGAAKSAKIAFKDAGAASVTLVARSNREGAAVFSSPEAKKLFEDASIVISTIPAEVAVPSDWRFKPGAVLLDAIYSSESAMTRKAITQSIRILPGIDWLIGQGRTAFSLFTGISKDAVSSLDAHDVQQNDDKKPVFLVGMMGSGKSSALKKLSELDYSVCDLDFEIEQKAGKKIAQIFSEQGEDVFRKLEHDVLVEVLAKDFFDVIACGGGTPFYMNNDTLLKKGLVFWIWCSLTVISARVKDGSSRPLLAGKTVEDSLQDILTERFSRYAELSDLIIGSTNRTAQHVADRIHYEISSTRKN